MTTKTKAKEPALKHDPIAVLKAADEIAQLEDQIKAKKKAMKDAVSSVLKNRRKTISKILNLPDITSSTWNGRDSDMKRKERNLVLDSLAKAHAGGRITIPGLDD